MLRKLTALTALAVVLTAPAAHAGSRWSAEPVAPTTLGVAWK